jgi:hypothetical protein
MCDNTVINPMDLNSYGMQTDFFPLFFSNDDSSISKKRSFNKICPTGQCVARFFIYPCFYQSIERMSTLRLNICETAATNRSAPVSFLWLSRNDCSSKYRPDMDGSDLNIRPECPFKMRPEVFSRIDVDSLLSIFSLTVKDRFIG